MFYEKGRRLGELNEKNLWGLKRSDKIEIG